MNPSIVLLSIWDNPDLPYFVEYFQKENIPIKAIVCAGTLKEKDLNILTDRMQPEFFNKNLWDLDVSAIEFYFVKNHNDSKSMALLKRLEPDILVNAGTPNILKAVVLNLPKLGVINSHPGLMPEYRGCCNLEWAIYNDDPVGATCHFMTEAIDRGPILFQKAMKTGVGWSYRKIRTEMFFHGLNVMVSGIRQALKIDKNFKQMPASDAGKYYGVITAEAMQVVLDKLAKRQYASIQKERAAR